MTEMKTRIKKFLGKLGFTYCPECGESLWFDWDRYELGYRTHSICPHCVGGKENEWVK